MTISEASTGMASQAGIFHQAGTLLEAGELVVVADSGADRGFFLGAAALASDRSVNTAITWGRGLTCFSVSAERAISLGLLLGGEVRDGHAGPVFLRSVEAATCEGTGISAADRAETLRAAGAADAGMGSLKSPGHVMPAVVGLRGQARGPSASQPRGQRASAENALALIRRLTSWDVAAWTDILDDDGELASAAHCRALAARLGMICLEPDDILTEG